MKVTIRKEILLIFFICFFWIIISIYPSIHAYLNTPKGYNYTFIHNSISDYPYYISFIRQGTYGRNLAIDQFTSEKQNEGFYHIFYLWIGKLGSLFKLDPKIIYFFARILLGIILLFVCYRFIAEFFFDIKERLITFIIFILAGSWPNFVHTSKGIEIWQFLFWWTEVDAFRRATFIPHFLIGHAGLVLMIYLFLELLRNFNILNFSILVLTGLFTGLIHPPSLGMVYYIFLVYIFILLILKILSLIAGLLPVKNISLVVTNSIRVKFSLKIFTVHSINRKSLNKTIILILSFILLSLPSLLYIYYLTSNVFPWTLMKSQESLFYAINLKEYFLSIGPILLLGIFGIIYVILNRIIINYKITLLIIWILLVNIMIPLSEFIHNSKSVSFIPTFANIRFLSMVIQLPLAIMGMIFLKSIYKINKIIYLFIFIFIFTLSLLVLPSSFSGQLSDFHQSNQYRYVPDATVEIFKFLEEVGGENTLVLASHENSLLLPLFSKNKVYAGQSIYTADNRNKENQTTAFFEGKIDTCSSFRFLTEKKINYVFSTQKEVNTRLEKMVFLKIQKAKMDAKIFKVLNNVKLIGCI